MREREPFSRKEEAVSVLCDCRKMSVDDYGLGTAEQDAISDRRCMRLR